MKWFKGSVANAIARSREEKLIFAVVLLHSPELNNKDSRRMEKYWQKAEKKNITQQMVCYRIYEGSLEAQQFSQIYPTPVVPLSFLIDLQGRPLEALTLPTNEAKFLYHLEAAIQIHNERLSNPTAPIKKISEYPTHIENYCDSSSESIDLDNHSIEPNEASQSVNALSDQVDASIDRNIAPNQPLASSENTNNAEVKPNETIANNGIDSLSIEEKAERARELIKKNRTEAEKAAISEENKKEIERRKEKKALAEAASRRNELEVRELAEKRRKEKRETEQYLKKLREQIKADREEKRCQLQTVKNVEKNETVTCDISQCLLETNIGDTCRIQCKFPDGKSAFYNFSSDENFSRLIECVQKEESGLNDFYLIQMHPRREFPDVTRTFKELDLAPSATLLAIEKRKTNSTPRSTSPVFLKLIQYSLISPFQVLYQFILYLLGFNRDAAITSETQSNTPESKENKKTSEKLSRKEGNVRRFRNEQDFGENSDDEARWNGNSTQQL